MRSLLAIASAAFALHLSVALAHSPLEVTVPADGAVLEEAPDSIRMSFKRGIRLTKIELINDGGPTVELDLSEFKGFAEDFAIPSQIKEPGSYVIEWRGLGDDGHPQNGSFSFVVE